MGVTHIHKVYSSGYEAITDAIKIAQTFIRTLAEDINSFMQINDLSLASFLLGLIFFSIGVSTMLFAKVVVLKLDKKTNRVDLVRYDIFGSKSLTYIDITFQNGTKIG